MKKLFTERHGGMKPRVADVLDSGVRRGLLAFIRTRIEEHWFGEAFPSACGDGYAYAGCDERKLQDSLRLYDVIWPGDYSSLTSEVPEPSDGQVFDLIEFSYEHVALPIEGSFHSYMGHTHYGYDKEKGQAKFEEDINRIFERNGLAFQLKSGEVERIAPAVLQEALAETKFKTGDSILDGLLETSRHKFLNRSLSVRLESLEKLWDAWERLKTIEAGKDKKARVTAILDKVGNEPNFRERIEKEALELTEIGNKFMIRHTETDKVPVKDSAQVDYLFHRMFALIWLLLHASGRLG